MAAKLLPTEVVRRSENVETWLLQQAHAKVTRGPDKGREATMQGGRLVMGTDPECDLVLTDTSASRRHCELAAEPSGLVLRDLGSTNGTFVADLRIEKATLPPQTILVVGRNQVTVCVQHEREERPLSRHERFGELLGRSPAMRHAFNLLDAAAQSDSTVLLEGESGTGKELAARAIHARSTRSEGPFVVVDCGAMAPTLLESELFGHEKGAFTGATITREGALAAAHRGTLFLDEVGELELSLQPKLLRFLERRELRPLGSNTLKTVDVRVVAATHRRLEQMTAAKSFREDLYYRLAVIRVRLPALRERPEDIAMLALAMAAKLRPHLDPQRWLDEATLTMLGGYAWPGNVRELRNVVERLAALPGVSPETLLRSEKSSESAPLEPALATRSYHEAKDQVLERFERDYLTALLKREQGVVVRAAEVAGVPRQTLFRLIKKHGLKGE